MTMVLLLAGPSAAQVPAGSVDCGNGNYCPAGNACLLGGQCAPRVGVLPGSSRTSSGGWCPPGLRENRFAAGKCIPNAHRVRRRYGLLPSRNALRRQRQVLRWAAANRAGVRRRQVLCRRNLCLHQSLHRPPNPAGLRKRRRLQQGLRLSVSELLRDGGPPANPADVCGTRDYRAAAGRRTTTVAGLRRSCRFHPDATCRTWLRLRPARTDRSVPGPPWRFRRFSKRPARRWTAGQRKLFGRVCNRRWRRADQAAPVPKRPDEPAERKPRRLVQPRPRQARRLTTPKRNSHQAGGECCQCCGGEVDELRKALEAERKRTLLTSEERDLNRETIATLEKNLRAAEARQRTGTQRSARPRRRVAGGCPAMPSGRHPRHADGAQPAQRRSHSKPHSFRLAMTDVLRSPWRKQPFVQMPE